MSILPGGTGLIAEGYSADSNDMAIMRSGPEGSQPPATLLESVSPYGSRRLTVEYDGVTTAAYLHDESSVISATWIANHVRAPRAIDPQRLGAGQAPLMPAAHTKHPRGRPPLDAACPAGA